ncbi:hypothetical protein EC2749250_0291 [Escherichia coli 2749250]|nr:hypothetical protein EC2749250_0291 [Escherichia coli 2749250]
MSQDLRWNFLLIHNFGSIQQNTATPYFQRNKAIPLWTIRTQKVKQNLTCSL